MGFEHIVTITGILLILSILISRISEKLKIPSLLLFLLIGMLAGSEGLGRIDFTNAELAQHIGIIALIFILFSGGLDTNWKQVRPVLWRGLTLSTIGVLITALLISLFSMFVLQFSFLQGLLLGSIIASTDAAAVFSVLRSSGNTLKGKLPPLVELESGINDPMAVFLTTVLIKIIKTKEIHVMEFLGEFMLEMIVGLVFGIVLAKILIKIIKYINLDTVGLYPVLTFAGVLFVYGSVSLLHGSGFLAVYIFGLIIGNGYTKNSTVRKFHDGIAGLMEICMFIVLGLLVFPSKLIHVFVPGILTAFFVIVVARPVGVFLSLLSSSFSSKEKIMVSWLGLRGAIPIILAIFPLLAGVEGADIIFNIVFFVVISSTLIQGTTIPFLARKLKLLPK